MKIRIIATPEETRKFINIINKLPELLVENQSTQYANRGASTDIRTYLDLYFQEAMPEEKNTETVPAEEKTEQFGMILTRNTLMDSFSKHGLGFYNTYEFEYGKGMNRDSPMLRFNNKYFKLPWSDIIKLAEKAEFFKEENTHE